MKKLNWIFALLLAAGITASSFSSSQAMQTDSLHYRLSSDTAVWSEELAAYMIDVDFEMKYDVPAKPLLGIVAGIHFDRAFFSYLTDSVDSANWQSWYAVVGVDSSNALGRMTAEWKLFPSDDPDTSRTTGDFVRYGTITFKIVDQKGRIEGGITFVRSPGNDILITHELEWDMLDSNYIDGIPVFLGVTETPCCTFPGDANNNGQFNIADVTYNIARIFAGGPPPPCMAEADADANATLNIADVTFMIARIFAGGPAPSCVSTII